MGDAWQPLREMVQAGLEKGRLYDEQTGDSGANADRP
jgi:hypothetical protein